MPDPEVLPCPLGSPLGLAVPSPFRGAFSSLSWLFLSPLTCRDAAVPSESLACWGRRMSPWPDSPPHFRPRCWLVEVCGNRGDPVPSNPTQTASRPHCLPSACRAGSCDKQPTIQTRVSACVSP